MKIIAAAIAAAFAIPAAAQTAPAPTPQHQGHGQHQGHDQHGQGQPGQPREGRHCCCCEATAGRERPACCDEHRAPQQGHSGHQ